MHQLQEQIFEEAVMAAEHAEANQNFENNIDEDVSVSASSASSSSVDSDGSAMSHQSHADESWTSDEYSNSTPLIVRLFEHQVSHSEQSDTWRCLLRNAAPDLVNYLSRLSDTAVIVLDDPFYPELEHEIRLIRRQKDVHSNEQDDRVEEDFESLDWRIADSEIMGRFVSMATDSSESKITLTSSSGVRRWRIQSLQDYAKCFDAVYLNRCRLSAERTGMMRGRYHGCRRG